MADRRPMTLSRPRAAGIELRVGCCEWSSRSSFLFGLAALNHCSRVASRHSEQRQRRPFGRAPALLPFRSVATLTPVIGANSARDAPSFART